MRRGGIMPGKYKEPDWPHVKRSYEDAIRTKLNEAGATKAKKLAGIAYWRARLAEDEEAILTDQPLPTY